MTFNVRFAHINAGPYASLRQYNVDGVLEKIRAGGVGTFNEIGTASITAHIRNQPGIDSHLYGANGIVWDENTFELVEKATYKIMTGGYVGADGVATPDIAGDDDRRVGPNRYLLVAVLRHKATGTVFIAAATHLVARADTVALWRRAIRAASIKLAGYRLHALTVKYNAAGVLVGDMNFRGALLDWNYLTETQLPTLVTYGKYSKYDRAYTWGKVKMVPETMKTFTRKSDHKGIEFYVVFDGVVAPAPAPTPSLPPAPKPLPPLTPKQRRWVRWARSLSRRWKRRHPIRWRRIRRRLRRLAPRY